MARESFPHKPLEIFTALDLEMNQPSEKIIQIGACVGNIVTGDILESFSVFINPDEILAPRIVDLTGISQDDVDGGVPLLDGYLRLKEMHQRHGSFVNCITWGGGDSHELLRQLKQQDPDFQGWCFGRRWIDAKTLFVSWRIANGLAIQGGLAKSLPKIGLQFKGKKHNAKSDAENTFRMYQKLLQLLKD